MKAVNNMKWSKAEGSNGAVTKMMEASGEFKINKITKLANQIYSIGQVSEPMKESVFIVIPTKKVAVEYIKHRKVSIMSQIVKKILKVQKDRLKRTIRETVDDMQFGFRKGIGT